MNDSITIEHGLPQFIVTAEPRLVPSSLGKLMYVTEGKISAEGSELCSHCGRKGHVNGHYVRKIRDIEMMGHLSVLRVTVRKYICPECHRGWQDPIPFSDSDHNVTIRLRQRVLARLSNGSTITECSKMFSLHPNTVYRMDKSYLESLYKGRKPRMARYIGIDEFLLHRGHRYATVVTDLENGHILFLEAGKKKQQAYDFFQHVGDRWMSQVIAVSMDMNAQYDSAFRERYPHIHIVYDFFHMVKMYNDTVITALRRRLQAELSEKDPDKYNLMKNSRFILLSSAETIAESDRKAIENNRRLRDEYLSKHLPLPPGERLMQTGRKWKLDQILRENRQLQVAYYLLEQFKLAYEVKSREELEKGMEIWMRLAAQSGCDEVLRFRKAIESRMDGILSHADYPIDSGVTEGVNNMTKTIRRKAYGFKDTDYFFYKIMHESRRPRYTYQSNRIPDSSKIPPTFV